MEDFDRDKVDGVVLALMYLTLHDGYRAWKSFDDAGGSGAERAAV